MSDLTFSDDAWRDYLYWQTQDRKTLKRINGFLRLSSATAPKPALESRSLCATNPAGAGELTRKTAFYTISWKTETFA